MAVCALTIGVKFSCRVRYSLAIGCFLAAMMAKAGASLGQAWVDRITSRFATWAVDQATFTVHGAGDKRVGG